MLQKQRTYLCSYLAFMMMAVFHVFTSPLVSEVGLQAHPALSNFREDPQVDQ
jgi:hypothetical protein